MIVIALATAAATLIVGVLAAVGLRRLPSLSLQLVALGLVSVLLPLGAVTLSGALMFRSGHDLAILVAAASSATAALGAGLVIARSTARSLDRLRRPAAALAAGDLGARAPETGPRELAEVGASFNDMAEGLERLFDARRQLVAWASHDLRTPLASLQAMIEAMEDGIAPPERYLPAMRGQARALGSLVDDLFELARIDAGALTLELCEAELAGLVSTCLRGVEAEAEAQRVRLEARIADGVGAVRCAPDKVERVLGNLLANALRHTPSDGAVVVAVRALDDRVQVSVEDTGEGMGAQALTRAFDRFWRADPARATSTGGAGLGLAIARGLVEAQGGRIWAEDRPEGGARVLFTLPAA